MHGENSVHEYGLAFAVVACVLSGAAMAQEPPALTNIRYDEDWSTAGAGTPKHVDLGDGAWLGTGIELRARNETYHENLWGDAPAPNDGYLLFRAMPYADLHAGRFRAFVQPIAAYAASIDPSPGPVDQTRLDLLQGFAEVTLPAGEASLSLRAGRQMLSLGTERLVGTRYGPNVPLAFDGGRATLKSDRLTVSAFAMRPVRAGSGTFDDGSTSDRLLWGVYAARPGLDLYYLGYRARSVVFGPREGRELRHSLGLRSYGDAGDWHWNWEGVIQFGRFAGGSILAWTLGTETGRRFPEAPLAPDVTLRFNIVSGDTNAADGWLGTFNALFPKGRYFGELSPVGPYNIVNLNPQVSLELGRSLVAGISAQAYWRYAREDGIYDIPGGLIRAPGTARSKFIGKQIEGTLEWQATRELALSASLSAFAPGGFIRETGPARTIGMFAFEASYKY